MAAEALDQCAELRAEVEALRKADDCGAGPAGCRNAMRKCRRCEVEALRDPHIEDRCTSCDNQTLFIGKGGWLTCSNLSPGCKEPGVTRAITTLRTDARTLALRNPTSAAGMRILGKETLPNVLAGPEPAESTHTG